MLLLQYFSLAVILLPGLSAVYYKFKPAPTVEQKIRKKHNLLLWNSVTLLATIPTICLSSYSTFDKCYGIGLVLTYASDLISDKLYETQRNNIPAPARDMDTLLTVAAITYSFCLLYCNIFG